MPEIGRWRKIVFPIFFPTLFTLWFFRAANMAVGMCVCVAVPLPLSFFLTCRVACLLVDRIDDQIERAEWAARKDE